MSPLAHSTRAFWIVSKAQRRDVERTDMTVGEALQVLGCITTGVAPQQLLAHRAEALKQSIIQGPNNQEECVS